MKRALLLVPMLAMLFSMGCAVRADYYGRTHYYRYRDHRYYHDRDDYRRDRDDYRRDRWR